MLLFNQELIYTKQLNMDRNTIQKILIGLLISACLFIGLRLFNVTGGIENPTTTKTEITANSSSSRMT